MKKLLTLILLSFLCYTTSWCETDSVLPDSLQEKLKLKTGKDRLRVFRTWFRNQKRGTDLNPYIKVLEQYCLEAESVVGRDTGQYYCFSASNRILTKAIEQQQFTYVDKLVNRNKILADSCAHFFTSPHKSQVIWHITYMTFFEQTFQYKKAIEQLKKAEELNKKVKSDFHQYVIWRNLGYFYFTQEDFEQSELYLKKALVQADLAKINNRGKLFLYHELGTLYESKKDLDQALFYFKTIVDSSHLHSKRIALDQQLHYWRILVKKGKAEEVLPLLEKMEREFPTKENFDFRIHFLEEITIALTSVGRFEEAKKRFQECQDLIWEDEKSLTQDHLFRLQSDIQIAQNETDIKNLEKEKTANQSKFNFGLSIAGIIGLLALGGLFFSLQRNKSKRAQLALFKEKETEITENRNRLFSSITHDIRTPLSLMMAPVERASQKITDPTIKKDLNMVRRNGQRLMNLFTQILDWNKVESLALYLNPQIGELDVTLSMISQYFEQQSQENGITFKPDFDIALGQFELDYDKLEKILNNLFSNAIKFCSDGDTIYLKAKTNAQKNRFEIEFTDNGPGIPKQEQEKIFDRYFQGNIGKNKGGTGIGLALVKELSNIMKGNISLSSDENKGTSFFISLPIIHVPEDENAYIESAIKEDGNLEKPKLLLIEDEPELLTFIESSLQDKYEVVTADSAMVGFLIADSQVPDIIISDWNLPDQNGGWVCKKIKETLATNHIPVMILTANNSDLNQKEAFHSGAVAWMSKPFRLETLTKQLQGIIDQQNRTRTNLTEQLNQKVQNKKEEPAPVIVLDPFLKTVYDKIEKNYKSEDYSVLQLAESVDLHRVQLARKIKKLLGITPSFLIKKIRLEKAKMLLTTSDLSISEIAHSVGYGNGNYFSTAYKSIYNISPTDQREQ